MKANDLSNPLKNNELNDKLQMQGKTSDSSEMEKEEKGLVDSNEDGNTEDFPIEIQASHGSEQEENEPEQQSAEETKSVKEDPESGYSEEKQVESELQNEPDYSSMEKKELVDRLVLLLGNDSVSSARSKIEAIKQAFYKKHNEEVAQIKANFLADGGEEKDFEPVADELEHKMRGLLQKYKDQRSEENRNLEQEKEENLKKKYEIIEKIKELVNRKESIDKTFHDFRMLQKQWHEIGMVPQQALKHLWENYHHHVENFYDYIKINKELRDLDLKKNMQAKIRLCEEAEKLLDEHSEVNAFNTLQKFHEQWREIGPVPREEKDELWERFKKITKIINRKHQEFYEELRSDQKGNLEKKKVLCEKAEEIANKEIDSHAEWNDTSQEIIALQKEWRTIGFAPRKENNKIYKRFRTACDRYFDGKRDYYLKLKDEQLENLAKKEELCEIAENLKDSTDWKNTTERLIVIQKEWKAIGPIPRKFKGSLWSRFRSACDQFFNRKAEHFENADSGQLENLKQKEELIQNVKDHQLSGNSDEDLNSIRKFQKEWSQIGHVPFKKKDKVQEEFRRAINALYDKMNLDTDNKEVQKFKVKIDGFLTMDNSEDKILVERNKLTNKIKQLESDIALWENNIGFFSESKTSGSIVRDVEEKIEKGKQALSLLQEKLNIIDGLV